jgi:hypothetical protein
MVDRSESASESGDSVASGAERPHTSQGRFAGGKSSGHPQGVMREPVESGLITEQEAQTLFDL